ncbi:helix-turn-helix domain-containing protein [Crossiella cryophila]|uniref:PucR family transcriptional regulator n=1 Tax=Crossiella cryophila TaxID=43355 RepID=A0A7W7CC13_9PSEU|nr:helix-turn-helix domain-containing protein [Crossiella cryophila]MBB4678387.1 hypothetical protein [Crossiella cryophila]
MTHAVRDTAANRVRELGFALLRRADAHTEELTDLLQDALPVYRSGLVLDRAGLRAACRDRLRVVYSALARRPCATTLSAAGIGRRRAAAGVSLATLLEAAHLLIGFIWRRLADTALHTGFAGPALAHGTQHAWDLHEEFVRELVLGYQQEIAAGALEAGAAHTGTMRALLRGSEPVISWAATEALGLPREGTFLAVAATAVEGDAARLISTRLRAAGMSLGWTELDGVDAGIIATPARAESLISLLHGLSGVQAGVSPAYRSLTGTARAFRLARTALDAGTARNPVVCFDSAPLAMIAASSPAAADGLAEVLLAPLADLPEVERELLVRTLGAWLDAGGSAGAAGELLYCHPNTVRYRLRKLQERTGRSLADPVAVTELALAYEAGRRRRRRPDGC